MTMAIIRPECFDALPAAVIVDTDNTLYAYEPAHEAALTATRVKAARILGISAKDFDRAYKEGRDRTKARLEGTASSHSRLLYFQAMLEILGLRTQVLLALDLEQTYWRVFLSSSTLFDHVKDFLDDLRIAGIPTAILTDLTAQIQFRKIVYFGLDDYFDYVVTSEEVGFDKPRPEAFQLTLSKIGPIEGKVWMIGDHPLCDIRGAREAIGAVTLQKRHQGVDIPAGAAGPDLVFDHFSELQALLRQLTERGSVNERKERPKLNLTALRLRSS